MWNKNPTNIFEYQQKILQSGVYLKTPVMLILTYPKPCQISNLKSMMYAQKVDHYFRNIGTVFNQ